MNACVRASLFAFGLAALSPGSLHAQPVCPSPFDSGAATFELTNGSACGLVDGDLDLDGDTDVVVTEQVSWYFGENDGAGNLTATRHNLQDPDYAFTGDDACDDCDADTDGFVDDVICCVEDQTTGEAGICRLTDVGDAAPGEECVTVAGAYHCVDVACDRDDGSAALACAGDPLAGGAGVFVVRPDNTVVQATSDKAVAVVYVDLDVDGQEELTALIQSAAGDELRIYTDDGVTVTLTESVSIAGSLQALSMTWFDDDFYVLSADVLGQSSTLTAGQRSGGTGLSAGDYNETTVGLPGYIWDLEVQDTERLSVSGHREQVDVTVVDGTGDITHHRGFDFGTGTFDATESISRAWSGTPCSLLVTSLVAPDGGSSLIVTDPFGAVVTLPPEDRAHTVSYGDNSSCTGTNGALLLDADPAVPGFAGDLELSNLLPYGFSVIVFYDAPAVPGVQVSPECTFNAGQVRCNVIARADGPGVARLALRAPPGSEGSEIHAQGVGFDPNGVLFGALALSNSVMIRVGTCTPE